MEKKDKKKKIKRIPEENNEKNEMEKTKKYKVKRKAHPRLKKAIIITVLVILFAIMIAAGILFGKVYGIFKDAKLDMEEIVIKYENSVVKDIDGNDIAVLNGD